MSSIRIAQAHKRFGTSTVLSDVNLHIEDGEMFSLLGPSGCGKTTTLRAIAGLESLDEGHIYLGERRVEALPPGERDVAFVFQLYTLYPHLSVAGNIGFPLQAAGAAKSKVEDSVREMARLLQIEPLLHKKPSELSGGDMQRVTIARALVRSPQALLMDEPLGALDAKLREDMRAELIHLHSQRRITTVLVTHDQVEAMAMAQRIAVMHAGKVQQIGSPQQVYAQPGNLFVAQFIGAPSMNVWKMDIAATATTTASGGVGLRFPGSQVEVALPVLAQERLLRHCHPSSQASRPEQVLLGIRPEDLRVEAQGLQGILAVVEQYEPLGLYDLVSLRVNSAQGVPDLPSVRVRVKPRLFREVGQAVRLDTASSTCHLFDVVTEDALA